ncbi:BglG family transcription antiterminator [Salinicoccus jeotgali]|uniref:BglG family transcription antiterminator n=1 Tax=Salinicoccus jeotgali TaxID=381634 RepID=A0ABP7E933_9STAP
MISSREKKIITELIHHNGNFLLIKELATKLGVSSRTIHRELKNVTHTLESLGLILIKEYNRGVKLDLPSNEVETLIKHLNANAVEDLSTEEKKVALLYHLMLNNEGLKKNALAVELGISEHVVDDLIEQMRPQLEAFELTITKTRSIGIQLIGDSINKQNFLADMMVNELNSNSIYSVIENNFVFSSLVNNRVIGTLEADTIFKVERLLMDELEVLPYQLTENAYLNLALHIVLAIDRTKNDSFLEIRQDLMDELSGTQEFQVSRSLIKNIEAEFSIEFPDEETYFISMHLRGSRRKFQGHDIVESLEQRTISFIDAVSQRMNYPFFAHPELKDGLIMHIEPTLHRMESGIITDNPLLESIRESYPRLFEVVGECFAMHFKTRRLSDAEIGFLTIHFGGALSSTPNIEVTTVCSSGIGTSRILANQLKTRFSNISIRQELSISELREAKLRDDELVLSTVPLDLERYILVSPLLDDQDEKKITEAINQMHVGPTTIDTHSQIKTAIDPIHVIQASELYLNRSHITLTKRMDALETIQHVLHTQEVADEYSRDRILTSLSKRFKKTGFIIGEHGLSYPHVRSSLLKSHHIFLIENKAGIIDRNYLGDEITTTHQILVLVPEDSLIIDLISEISILFGEHHDDTDTLFENPALLENIIKNYISTLY